MSGNIPFIPRRRFLRGTTCAVDAQGRIAMPKHWRLDSDDASTVFMLAPGYDKCIDLYDEDQFNEMMGKIYAGPFDQVAVNHVTIWSELCQEINLDKQGRFSISDRLLKYAGIEKQSECQCIGAMTHGRIFSNERWHDFQSNLTPKTEIPTEQAVLLSPEERTQIKIESAIKFIGELLHPATPNL